MSAFREMVLLPLNEYKRFTHQLILQQQQQTKPSLLQDLNEVKEIYGDSLPADQRLKIEGNIISKHAPHITQETVIPPSAAVPQVDLLKNHFNALPKTNQRRATQIYQHMKDYYNENPMWNTAGQLKDSTGNHIAGSNIVDLIDAVTNARKMSSLPTGFHAFMNVLDETNIPMHLLSKAGVERVRRSLYKQSSPSISDDGSYQWKSL